MEPARPAPPVPRRSPAPAPEPSPGVAPVQIGVVDEQQGIAQVTDGLQAGDKIVVGNVGTLGRGMKVTIAGAERQQARGQ